MFIRDDWKQASHFHDLTEAEVLREVARRVAEVRVAGRMPIVLLDLDSTLYEVGPRTHRILQEWLDTPDSTRFPGVRRELERLEQAHVGYSLRDTFAALGMSASEAEVQQAISVMEKSELVAETLGEHVFDFFLRNKRAEWQEYRRQVTQWELNRYLPSL